VRDAAPLDRLVGHPVIGNFDAGDEQELAVADDAVLPTRDLARGIGRCLQALEGLRPKHALGDVLFPRPYQLDGAAYLFGDERAFGGVVAQRTAAEAAAHVALVEIHLLGREAERLRHRLAGFVGRLTALPDLDLVASVVDAHDRIERFHLGVIAVVAAELGVIGLGRGGKGGGDVALLFELDRLRIRIGVDLDVILERPIRIEAFSLGLAPRHFQGIAAGLRILEMIGDDSQTIGELDDGDDAAHGLDLGVVPALRRDRRRILLARIPNARLRVVNGRMQGRGIDHPRQFHVDGVLRRAVDLRWRVAPRH
jgi:hypothetical protein